ncbi:MAG TPA: MFS transporter [Acidimicrobiia bacterium]|jgi:MFS family permease
MAATTSEAPDIAAVEERGFAERTLSSMRSRNFRLFFIGQTVSNSGNWLTMVALTLLVLHRTGSGVMVGVLSACQYGPILLLAPWAGVIVDRTSKRKLLLATQILEMGQSFTLAALAFMHHAPLWAFFITAVAGGCMLAFDNTVRRTFVNEMVPQEDVPNAVTLYSAIVNISRIIGPAIAGVLVVTVGYGWCFTLDAISYLTVLVALWMMRPAELRPIAPAPREKGQVRAGVKYLRSVPELWITFATLLIVGTLSYNFSVVFPLFVEKGLHGSDSAYTFVYVGFSAGSLVGAFLVARRSNITVPTVAAGAALFGAALTLFAFAPSVAAAIGIATIVGVGSVYYMTATTALAQLRTEPHMIGRVLALQAVLMIGTTPVGAPILGLISDTIGPRAPVFVGAIGALGAAVFAMFMYRRTMGVEGRVPPRTAEAAA